MSTFLSLVGEQDQAATLMNYVVAKLYKESDSGKEALVKELTAQIRKKDWAAFTTRLLALEGLKAQLMVNTPVHQLSSFVRVIAHFIAQLEDAVRTKTVANLLDVLGEAAGVQAQVKAELYVALYNSFPPNDGAVRCAVFRALTEHCHASKLDHVLHDRLMALDSLVASWKVDGATARPVYRAANKLLARVNGPAALKQQVNFLQTFAATDSQGQASVVAEAVEAVRQAINLPGAFVVYDILELGAVQLLKGDTKDNRNVLFSLLQCLVNGNMADFEKIASGNAAALTALNVDVEAARTKMRLLTVTTICANAFTATVQENSQNNENDKAAVVALSDIAKALDVKDDLEAESWLLHAISENLVRAKVDQLAGEAIVSYATRRSIDQAHWKMLSTKLGQWTSNLEQLLKQIQPESKPEATGR